MVSPFHFIRISAVDYSRGTAKTDVILDDSVPATNCDGGLRAVDVLPTVLPVGPIAKNLHAIH
jgi:hypothetical protein